MRSTLLLLALAAITWAIQPTLIISAQASYSGSISTTYQYMYFVVNNSSKPMQFLGKVVPPFGASVIYVTANGSYPPPVAVFYNITYINASIINNMLYCSNNSIIKIDIIIKNYMPFSVPVTILIQKPSGIDIISNATPTGVDNIGGSTVYEWAFVVSNQLGLTISYKIKDFGSFGAVNLPGIEVIASIDLSGYIDQANYSISLLNNTYSYLNNLTYAVEIFSNLIYNTTNNLDNLIQLLNLSSIAFKEGARGLNSSRYVIYALNAQLMALSSSLLGVASTLNRSLLLVQYEYAYLVTLANALESQAIAIRAYENSLSTSVQALDSIQGNLLTIYSSLQDAQNSINNVYNNLISIKNKINQIKSNNTLVENATKALNQELDYAISAVQNLQSAVDSALISTAALINIVSNTRNALIGIGSQLGQVEGVLNQTAVATRQNATAILEEIPPVIINASRSLVDIARNLSAVAYQVDQLAAPINSGVAYLLAASNTLNYTAGQLKSVSIALKGELLYIGLVNSIVSSYRYNITSSIQRYRYLSSIARTYEEIYGTGSVRYQFVLSLPTAVNPSAFSFEITAYRTQEGGKSALSPLVLIISTILIATSIIIIKFR